MRYKVDGNPVVFGTKNRRPFDQIITFVKHHSEFTAGTGEEGPLQYTTLNSCQQFTMRTAVLIAALVASTAAIPADSQGRTATGTDVKSTRHLTNTGGNSLGSTATLQKRANIANSCQGNLDFVQTALQGCAERAAASAKEALNGSSKLMQQIFHTSDQGARRFVSEVFTKIADECGPKGSGSVQVACEARPNCRDDNGKEWGAVTDAPGPDLNLCPNYFTGPIRGKGAWCHGLDAESLMVHEMSHALNATEDYAYGLDGVRGLSAERSLHNAESYGMFSIWLALKCSGDGMPGQSSQGTPGTSPNGSSGGQSQGSPGQSSQGGPESLPSDSPSQGPETPNEGPSSGKGELGDQSGGSGSGPEESSTEASSGSSPSDAGELGGLQEGSESVPGGLPQGGSNEQPGCKHKTPAGGPSNGPQQGSPGQSEVPDELLKLLEENGIELDK